MIRDEIQLMLDLGHLKQIVSPGDNLKPYYYISIYGKVYSFYTNKVLETCIKENGYVAVSLNTNDNQRIQRKVHRLVMLTFAYFPGCENLQVNHADGNKFNNTIYNLEWMTPKQNVEHAITNNLRKAWDGENNPNAFLNKESVLDIVNLILSGKSNDEIRVFYPISDSTINCIINKRRWEEVITDQMMYQMIHIRHPEKLLDYQKHALCYFYQTFPFIKENKGDFKNYILNAMNYCKIEINNSYFNQAKRLYYRYQDPEITSLYNY